MVDPETHDSCNKMQRRHVSELVEEFADELMTTSGKCMDIGCGSGNITKNILLPALAPDATMIGTDISLNMISYANKVYADDVRLTFDTLDIQTESLPEKYHAAFNLISSFHALHWCTDYKQVFNNIFRMLRPGGKMLLLILTSHDLCDIFEMLSRDIRYASYMRDAPKPNNSSTNPRKELKDLFIDVGFKVHHCSHRVGITKDKDHSEFLTSVKSCTPMPREMPYEQATQFWEDLKREFLKRKFHYEEMRNNEKQTVLLDLYKMLVVYASK